MENAMELPMITKVIALIGCAIFFGLVCTWGVLWPWLLDKTKYLGKLILARRWYLVTLVIKSGRYSYALSQEVEKYMFGKPRRPKTL